MRKLKLLIAACALLASAGVQAQSWTAPTITGEDPVSGTKYKVYNVGSGKYLDMGKSWFSWNSTAILSDNGIDFTLTKDGDNWKFIRTGTQGVFTSGNSIAGDAMHVDNTAQAYGITKMPNGYYHIHDAGGEASSTCWGYGTPSGQTVAGVVAHADANSSDWKCEWLFVGPVYNARVNLYNLLLSADSEGVDTDDASDVYNNASATVEQLTTAYNNLNQARYAHALTTASDSNPKDITEWVLTNPDFSTGNIDGWETNYVSGTQATNIGYQNNRDYTNGSVILHQFIEAWRSGNAAIGDGYLRQTVQNLPEGKYLLDCDAIAVNQGNASATTTGALLFITADGSDYTASLSTGNGAPEHFSTQFLFTGEGDVIFGLKTVSTTANWIAADNFKVTFYGIDLSAYATQLAAEVTTFEGYENSIVASVYSHLNTQVTALSTATYNSSKAYATAIANMQAINTYAATLVTAKALETAKMNATVLQALQNEEAKGASVDASDVDALTTATADLNTAITNANTSIANYAEAKDILDAANIYDSAGQANYAANETIAAIQTAYDDGSLTAVTNEQKAAAKVALATACKAQTQPADGCDMSPWIVNPNIDGDANGWTTYKSTGYYSGGPMKPSNDAFEFWAPTMDENNAIKEFDYYQTITELPTGAYSITASMLNSTNGEANAEWNSEGQCGVYGKTASDEKIALVTVNSETYASYTTDVILVVDGNLRIGVKNIRPRTGQWFSADDFKLTYVRQLTAEEEETIAKANAVEAYNEALAAAQAIEDGSIPSTAYSNLQTVITNNTLNDGTSSEYNAAATALSEAAAAAQPLVAPYTAWKTLKAQADVLVAVSTNDTDENATLASAISTQNTSVEAATDASTITSATSTLKTAMVTYATTAQPTNDECFDLTFMIVNPHFTEGTADNPTGWTANYPTAPENSGWHARELRASTHNFEAYRQQFTLSQTIPNLPKGTYKVTLQGFTRHDGDDKDKTNLFCGVANQKVKEISEEYSTTSLISGKPTMGDTNGEAVDNGQYRPNGMSASYYYFQETNPMTGQPFYTNEVQTLIPADGNLTIGFKCETWTDWVIWDNFHLYYYGSAIAVTIDENVAGSSYSEDIENANITLKRTFTSGKWNTIALPFDLTDAETKTAFGSDAEVATYSETADGTNSAVDFNTADDAAITANTPVLLKTSTTETTFTFNGKTIKIGEAKVAGENFEFVGTYAASTTIAEGDYFIGNNKLWKSTGATTIKGTRAYLKAKSADARIAKFIIDGEEATGIEGVEVAEKMNGKVYNLNGQLVEKAKKGLYIVNGKKVVVK